MNKLYLLIFSEDGQDLLMSGLMSAVVPRKGEILDLSFVGLSYNEEVKDVCYKFEEGELKTIELRIKNR